MTVMGIGANEQTPQDLNTLERRLLYYALAAKATLAGKTFNLDNGDNSEVLHVDVQKSYVIPAKKEMMRVVMYLFVDPRIDSNELDQEPWKYAEEITNNDFAPGYVA